MDICFTISALISTGFTAAGLLLFLFPLMHISNGYGLLFGLVCGKKGNPSTSTEQEICIRRLKEFEQREW
jgi:hypothetical protein